MTDIQKALRLVSSSLANHPILTVQNEQQRHHQQKYKKYSVARSTHPTLALNPMEYIVTVENQPQQMMAAITNITGQMVISWLTYHLSDAPVLQWRMNVESAWQTRVAHVTSFSDPQAMLWQLNVTRYIYQADIVGLNASTTYEYRVGDDSKNAPVWSETLSFTTMPPADKPVRLALFGDLGLFFSQSTLQLYEEAVVKHTVDAIVHVGDFAYNLHDEFGFRGDAWFGFMKPIMSHLPYMGCIGNHEDSYNITHYTHRFAAWNEAGKQSGSGHNWWYSWDYRSGSALVHMAAINTELYYLQTLNGTLLDLYAQQRQAQYLWLDADLASARSRGVSWLIVFGHRPMYCSNVDDLPDCTTASQDLRDGWISNNGVREYGMEIILRKYNVDIYFSGHQHSYERSLPVYQNVHEDVVDATTYVNPGKPVHIISGSAGCQEFFDYFDSVHYAAWSVVRSATYGYGHLIVYNATHLYWDQLLAEGDQGKDIMWIVKQGSSSSTSSALSQVSKATAGAVVGCIIGSMVVAYLLSIWCKHKRSNIDNFNVQSSLRQPLV